MKYATSNTATKLGKSQQIAKILVKSQKLAPSTYKLKGSIIRKMFNLKKQ